MHDKTKITEVINVTMSPIVNKSLIEVICPKEFLARKDAANCDETRATIDVLQLTVSLDICIVQFVTSTKTAISS